ncbi:MAG: ABC-2 type transport system permease protein, partial [Glaciecola sp.]
MYANVLSFSLYERLRSTVLTSLALGGFLVLGMWAYGSIGTDFYQSLPEAMLEITGIPANGDAAALAYNVILGTIASLTLAGLAVSMGAASIAGEEREGTLGLLLSNPRSRTAILGAKATAALVLTALGGLVLWAGAALAPV